MKKISITKILISSSLAIASVAGLAIGVVSCGSSDPRTTQTVQDNTTILKQTKNLLSGKGAESEKPLGGYDVSLNHGKFFLGVFSTLLTTNLQNQKLLLVNNIDGSFSVSKADLVKILKDVTNLNAELLSDDELLELNAGIALYQDEFNQFIKSSGSQIFPTQTELAIELKIEKNTNGIAQLNGRFKVKITLSDFLPLLQAKLEDPLGFVYNVQGNFVPENLIDLNKYKQEIISKTNAFEIPPSNHPVLSKTVLGYTPWGNPTYSIPQSEWKDGSEITVTYSATWTNDPSLEAPANKVITYKKVFTLKAEKISVDNLAITKLTHLFSGRNLDNLKDLDSYRKSTITGNFVFEILKILRDAHTTQTQTILTHEQTLDFFSKVTREAELVNQLTNQELKSFDNTFVPFATNGILKALSDAISFNGLKVKINFVYQNDENNNAVLKISINKSLEFPNGEGVDIFRAVDFFRGKDYQWVKNFVNNYLLFFVDSDTVWKPDTITYYVTTPLEDLAKPEILRTKLEGYSEWTAPTNIAASEKWENGKTYFVTYTANWLNEAKYETPKTTSITFIQPYFVTQK